MPSRQQKFNHRILIVDDDQSVRATMSALLSQEGYEVLTAADGFEALAKLRGGVPDLIISDLKMPNMSGFELLGVVRTRFPSVAVIVMSGEFKLASAPLDILSDRHFEKGGTPPMEVLQAVRELLAVSPLRSQPARSQFAPVWVPRSRMGYVVLTCTECLRSFSVPQQASEAARPPDEMCPHCGATVQYRLDANVSAAPSPGKLRAAESRKQMESAKNTIKNARQLIREWKDRTL